MKLTQQTGDVPADVLVELLQHLIRPTGSAKPISPVEACVLFDTVIADLTDNASIEQRTQLRKLWETVGPRVLAANK